MPSFTKSVSVALLVIASNNVLAAPFKESTAVDHRTDPCLVQTGADRDYISLLGISTKIVESSKYPQGCSEDQARRCAARETSADKIRAEERCPQIKDCPSDIISQVWASCLLKPVKGPLENDEGFSLGMDKGTAGLVSKIVPGLTSVSGNADANQGKQNSGIPGDVDGHAEVDIPGQTKGSDTGKGKLVDGTGVGLPLGQGNKGPADTGNLPLGSGQTTKGSDTDIDLSLGQGNKGPSDTDIHLDADTHGSGLPGKKGTKAEAEVDIGKDGECSCAPKASKIDVKAKAS